MRELRPGLWHWEAPHPQWESTEPWGPEVSSYAIDDGERLLFFDPIAGDVHEPGGEALVEVGADGLGGGLVGGVADQQVAEAIRILAGQQGADRSDELLSHQ